MLNELPLALAFLSLGRMSGKETYCHGSFWKKKARVGGFHSPTSPERATDKADVQQEELLYYVPPHITGDLGALGHHIATFFWAQAKKMPLTSSTPV